MPTEYCHRRLVQFHETDLAGIVHFSWYFRYMEEAEHALWRACGLSIADPHAAVAFPRVAATCDFLAPLRFEEEVEVHIRIEALGRRTIRYGCTLTRAEEKVATGFLTAVCVSNRVGEPSRVVDIPGDILSKLSTT